MKTILFPTDFSACADNALKFALGFAKKFNAKVVLHNSCRLPAFSEQIPFEGITEEKVLAEAGQKMKLTVNKFALENSTIPYETHIRLGLAGSDIVDYAKEIEADLIVMGTKGATGIERVLLGSIATAVIEKSSCPVITVPAETNFREIHKIVFATDYEDNDIESIKYLTTIAMPYQSEIIVVHITPVTFTDTLEKDRFRTFKDEVKSKVKYAKISFQLAVGLNIEEDLETIVKEQHADLLAMSMRRRNLFMKLFGPSLTKRMNYHTHIPMLTLHTS
jgi:nucleotide-binding universal stress UspA family protein